MEKENIIVARNYDSSNNGGIQNHGVEVSIGCLTGDKTELLKSLLQNESALQSQEFEDMNKGTELKMLVPDASLITQNYLVSLPLSKFQCDECNYSTKYKSNLTKHTKSLHELVKFPCTSCDYQCSDSSNLDKHRRNKHSL